MKTITLNSDNRSVLIAQDTDTVTLEADHVKRNNERIYGLPRDAVTLHEGVTVPNNWSSSRYFFDGTNWVENQVWVDAHAALSG